MKKASETPKRSLALFASPGGLLLREGCVQYFSLHAWDRLSQREPKLSKNNLRVFYCGSKSTFSGGSVSSEGNAVCVAPNPTRLRNGFRVFLNISRIYSRPSAEANVERCGAPPAVFQPRDFFCFRQKNVLPGFIAGRLLP